MTLHIGILGLQGDVREHRAAMAALGCETSVVRTPAHLAAVDGLIIPGGESTTMSLLAQKMHMLAPLRTAIAAGLPTYGSCAGMIMLAAQVLDGRADQQTLAGLDMVIRRNAFGRQVDSFEADIVLPQVAPEPFRAVFIRAPWVESVASDVEILGTVTTEHAEERIVAVRNSTCLATSFHPELTGDYRIHSYFQTMVAEHAA